MGSTSSLPLGVETADALLQVYLLGSVDFEAALALQRRLVYQVAGDREAAALILCEHPPLITVGRQGSWAHILYEPQELEARRWPVRWVNRGGGCLLHLPGQLAVYPILALDRLGLSVPAYLEQLHDVVAEVLGEFSIETERRAGTPDVWVGARPIAGLGVAVRHWVSYYGAVLNVSPDLQLLRRVRYGGADAEPMTSLERERRGPLRPSMIRERLVERFAERFHFARTSLFFDHPALGLRAPSGAVATNS
jgi:lipoyl(octanoyl) transferase